MLDLFLVYYMAICKFSYITIFKINLATNQHNREPHFKLIKFLYLLNKSQVIPYCNGLNDLLHKSYGDILLRYCLVKESIISLNIDIIKVLL